MHSDFDHFDESALTSRLVSALRKKNQEVTFVVGSPFSAPITVGAPGVPSTEGIISLIRQDLAVEQNEKQRFDLLIGNSGEKAYQEAFRFYQGRRGQISANELVTNAVLGAYCRSPLPGTASFAEEDYIQLESDVTRWVCSPATEALAALITDFAASMGRLVLTTNFDPLLEIAVTKAGGSYYRSSLQSDGDISQTSAPGCHIVHLHGFWHGSDTLHTNRQLTQARPKLKSSLARALKGKLIVVVGYGGWDDVLTSTIVDLLQNDNRTEILWCFHGEPPTSGPLMDRLRPGLERDRLFLYGGIDCNSFLPNLLAECHAAKMAIPHSTAPPGPPARFQPSILTTITAEETSSIEMEGDDEDRPPVVQYCLGREAEFELLKASSAKVIFVTGIGGQGKSTVAARYFTECTERKNTELPLWRDCKEEGERFENQLAAIVERISGGRISGPDLAKRDIQSIVDLLVPMISKRESLLVFDNVDHYINLEELTLTSSVEAFVKAFLAASPQGRVMFTCRPFVQFDHPLARSLKLEGISLEATTQLFAQREAQADLQEIEDAHSLTNGHAFWLDLLAIQVNKRYPGTRLSMLTFEIRSGKGELPANTLTSIWARLPDREKDVLRAMAETVRPEREADIAEYLRAKHNFHQVFKAMKALRKANLVVVKRLPSAEEVLELHPLVRSYIRKRFTQLERVPFVRAIIIRYKHFIGMQRSRLQDRPTFLVLQNWTQAAELAIQEDNLTLAFGLLFEVGSVFIASPYFREFVRVARMLFHSFDWVTDHLSITQFDSVFKIFTECLAYQGEYSEVDSNLSKFGLTVLEKNSRYILYCDMRAHTFWLRGQFNEALDWARRGRTLEVESDVDTDSNIGHTLALAERDSGNAAMALEKFLDGRTIDAVTDPSDLNYEWGGAYYGNVGRCLQLMGQGDTALVCFQKSALLIERDMKHEHTVNQGYIRLWVGELLVSRQQTDLGLSFVEAARRKWNQISRAMAERAAKFQERIGGDVGTLRSLENDVEAAFQDWIVGS